jgi:hypothetical protein
MLRRLQLTPRLLSTWLFDKSLDMLHGWDRVQDIYHNVGSPR